LNPVEDGTRRSRKKGNHELAGNDLDRPAEKKKNRLDKSEAREIRQWAEERNGAYSVWRFRWEDKLLIMRKRRGGGSKNFGPRRRINMPNDL